MTTITCICCETTFQSSRVRPSFKRCSKRDSDFCAHYKNGINPDFYVVRVCPNCGFASTENGMNQLSEVQRQHYIERLGSMWTKRDYGGERTLEQALDTYKLALLCAQIAGTSERVMAGLLHHIAWLHRYIGNKEQEQRFLQFALNSYIEVFEREGESVNDAKLMYLIGELYKRTGDRNKAVRWFSRVVNDKRIMDAAMIRASREQWQAIREETDYDVAYESLDLMNA
ncbi:hypothetical protein FHS18_005014 [Paenibacillus phyllosphaerae]|uniref:DUF2225 domain-containing protein n=1 Tax=Paenibacillus phyllosphaerae TaxID=274593 RepID=A0A7W5B1X1_9BACL|nr:hypothetical protein [Paenibacillus phyllosphaerae]